MRCSGNCLARLALNPTDTFGNTQTSLTQATDAGLQGPHKPETQTAALGHFIRDSP